MPTYFMRKFKFLTIYKSQHNQTPYSQYSLSLISLPQTLCSGYIALITRLEICPSLYLPSMVSPPVQDNPPPHSPPTLVLLTPIHSSKLTSDFTSFRTLSMAPCSFSLEQMTILYAPEHPMLLLLENLLKLCNVCLDDRKWVFHLCNLSAQPNVWHIAGAQ